MRILPTLQRPRRSYLVELAQFHSPEYLEFLQRILPEEQEVYFLPSFDAFGQVQDKVAGAVPQP